MTEAAPAVDLAPRNAVDRFVVTTSKVLSVAYALSIVVTIYDVANDIAGSPTLWVYDVVTTAIAVAFVFGGSYALQRREHIQITAIYDRYSPRAKLLCDAVSYAATLIYFMVVAWFSWRLAHDSVVDWEVGGSAWAQPTPVVVKVSMFIGTALMIVQAFSNLGVVLRTLGRVPPVVLASFAAALLFAAYLAAMLSTDGTLAWFRPLDWLAGGSFSPGIQTISLLMLVAFMVLIFGLGMPIGFATGLIAVIFCVLFRDIDALSIITFRTYGFINSYVLLSVPMFLLMAAILDKSGVAHDLYDALKIWAGGLPGGVAVMTLVAASVMAAMTGIIGGEVILLGLVALPQMLRLGYDSKLAIGVVCAGGSLGTMIPPSLVLVFYGLTTSTSIGDLFLASTVPGLMLAGIYMAYVLIRCAIDPKLGPPAPRELYDIPLSQKLAALRKVILPLLIIFSVLGSIYTGLASVSEAAAVGVAGVMIAAALRRTLGWAMLRDSLYTTMSTCGLLIWLTIGANAMVGVYNLLGGITYLKAIMTGLPLDPIGVILVMMAILVLLGCFMDWFSIMLLTMPIFAPTVQALGYDLIWFGVLFNVTMQVGYLSPPFGQAAFYLKSVTPPEITLNHIFISLLPFMGLQMLGLAIILFFPDVALWLPRVLG
ncbi:MAG: TRAP transporter large permease subunit [Alphaproteobacteria bacterium]|nr:TRAP transporter large permease subunit [Alphaproteobacteria bacterium]